MRLGLVTGDVAKGSLLEERDLAAMAVAVPDPKVEIERVINAAVPAGAPPLAVASCELYLIEGVNTVDLGQGPIEAVAFAPEFLYVAQVGKPARAGVSVFWNNGAGLGDPAFPNFGATKLRSIYGANASNLIYPFVARQLLIGLVAGADSAAAQRDLVAQGLANVRPIAPGLFEASTSPFEERATAQRIKAAVPAISYVELNAVVRAIDIHPGWRVRRVA